MKRIMWAEIYSKLLEESKFDIVVMVENRVHVGPLFFEIDTDEEIKETFQIIELNDNVSEKVFIDAIVSFYLANKDNPYPDTEGTLRHWFVLNGVNVNTSKNKYSKEIKIKHRTFRYNKTSAILEYVSDRGHIIDSIGLSRDEAESNLEYWCDVFNSQIDEELRFQIALLNKGK